jgi:ABC-type branched-subunit amino acid transport system substrate-binding protein
MYLRNFIAYFFFLIILPVYTINVPDIFSSLTSLENYAASVPENPKTKIRDWENPDFTAYHKTINPSYIEELLTLLGIIHPLWTIKAFNQLLTQVVTNRENEGFIAPLIYKLEPTPGSTFIIFSNLVGSFHSLIRDLRALEKQGTIDENLKIKDPHCFIVFNGNAAARSAYALETLTVMLSLAYINNEQVLFTLGTTDMDNYWQQYAIKRELKIRARSFNNEKIPMGKLITRFFNTIPMALYLVVERTDQDVHVVRISNLGFENKVFSVTACGNFFNNPDENICPINATNHAESTEVTVRALIRADPTFKSFYPPNPGLLSAGKENGAVTWSTFSGPTQASQNMFDFYDDAFVILTTALSLDDWILTLYNRDVREYDKIKPSLTVKLLSRQILNPIEQLQAKFKIIEDQKKFLQKEIAQLDKKISLQKAGSIEDIQQIKSTATINEDSTVYIKLSKEEIPLGKKESTISVATILDQSGLLKYEGESVETGIRAAFNIYNKQSTRGTLLDLITYDNQNQAKLARKEVMQALSKDNTGLILVPLSTLTIEACLDLIEKKQILALFPAASGATHFQHKNLTNLIFMRANGQEEAYAITQHAAHDNKEKKIALFYINNSFGKISLLGAKEALKDLGISHYISIPYEENNLNFSEQIKQIKQYEPDYIGIFCIQTAAKELLNQLGTSWLIGKKLFGTQDLSPQSFRKYIERNKLQFSCTSVVPNPEGPLEIAKQYRDATGHMTISNDIYCLEAFIGADFFIHILKNITPPITTKKIIDFIEHIHNYPYKGLTLDFDPETRQLLHSLWIIDDKEHWTEIKVKKTNPQEPAPDQHLNQIKSTSKLDQTLTTSMPKDIAHNKLNIASIADLSRGNAIFGKTCEKVMEFLIDRANREKEVPMIDLVILDHEYSPEKARTEIENLINTYKTDIILCFLGSQPYMSNIDFVKKGDIVTLFPIPGIPGKRFKLPHAIFLRASYYDEARIFTQYFLEHRHPQSIVLLYQDDTFGQALLDGAKTILDAKKTNYTAIPYGRNLTNFSTQIEQVKKINPNAIGLFSTPEASMEFLRQLGSPYIKKIQFFGSSDLSSYAIDNFIHKNEINCLRSNIVPNPLDPTLPLCQEFRTDMATAGIKPDTTALEIYLSTQIFLDIVKKMKGDINKLTIMQECEKIHNVDFKGIKLNFDPNTRQLLNTVWINEDDQKPWIAIPLAQEGKIK